MSSLDPPVEAGDAKEGQGKGMVIGAMVVAVLALIVGACGIIFGVKADHRATAAIAASEQKLQEQLTTTTASLTTLFTDLRSSTTATLTEGLASADSVAKAYGAEALAVARTAERAVSDISDHVDSQLVTAAAEQKTAIAGFNDALASHTASERTHAAELVDAAIVSHASVLNDRIAKEEQERAAADVALKAQVTSSIGLSHLQVGLMWAGIGAGIATGLTER